MPIDLTAQNRDLVPKHDDLDLLYLVTTTDQHHELQDPTEQEVKHRPRHKQP
jgi:hypothetical protein